MAKINLNRLTVVSKVNAFISTGVCTSSLSNSRYLRMSHSSNIDLSSMTHHCPVVVRIPHTSVLKG